MGLDRRGAVAAGDGVADRAGLHDREANVQSVASTPDTRPVAFAARGRAGDDRTPDDLRRGEAVHGRKAAQPLWSRPRTPRSEWSSSSRSTPRPSPRSAINRFM